jgi:hypothetical protein
MKKGAAKLILVLFALTLASLLLTSSTQGLLEHTGTTLAGDQIKAQGDPPDSWGTLYTPILTPTATPTATATSTRPVPNPALAERVWAAIERFVETYPMTDYFPNYASEHGGPSYSNAEANAWAACFDAPPHLDADPEYASRACTLWQASYLGLYHTVRAQRTGDDQDLSWASAYLDVSLDYLLAFVHGPEDSPTDYGYRDVMVSVWQNPLRAINIVLIADLLRDQGVLTAEQLAKFEHAMSAMLWAWHGEWWTTGQHPSHGVSLTTRTSADNPAYDIHGHQVVSTKAYSFHWDADEGNTPAEEVGWLGSAVMLASRALWNRYPAYRALYLEGQHYLDFAIAYDRPDLIHSATIRTLNSETSGGAYGQRRYWIENHSPDTPSLPYMGSAWIFIGHGLWASLEENQTPWPELYKDADHWWIMKLSLGETLRAPDGTYLVDTTPGHQQSYNLAAFPEWWTPCSVLQGSRQYVQYDGRAGEPPIFMSEIGHSAGQDILNAAWPAMRIAAHMEDWSYYDLWNWRLNTALDEFLANPPNPGWIECKTAVYVGRNQAYNWGRLIDVFIKAYLGPAGYQLEPWDLECCVGSQVYLPLVARGDMD